MNFQPTTLQERVHTLDVMRGISLLGILIVNMFAFALPLPHVIDLHSWFTDINDILNYQLVDIYAQGSFYPLFSMLFGYGLAMQYMKAQSAGTNFYRFAPKRLTVILFLGLVHAFLIWWGDILMTYAFCGFFLILLLRLNPWWLLTISIVIYGLFNLGFIGLLALGGALNVEFEVPYLDITAINHAITAYGTGTWGDAFFQRIEDLIVQLNIGYWFMSLFMILPYMLLGAAAAKWRLVERAKNLKVFWISLAVVCIGAGLFIKSIPFHYNRTYLLEFLKTYLGGPVLAIGYAAAVVSLWLIPFVPKLLSPLAKAGRMSLTLYLMQSIICTLLFYNFGFGLYGKIDVQMGVVIAIGIFVIQLALAELWFIKFKQGPIEYFVKRMTYGKINS